MVLFSPSLKTNLQKKKSLIEPYQAMLKNSLSRGKVLEVLKSDPKYRFSLLLHLHKIQIIVINSINKLRYQYWKFKNLMKTK